MMVMLYHLRYAVPTLYIDKNHVTRRYFVHSKTCIETHLVTSTIRATNTWTTLKSGRTQNEIKRQHSKIQRTKLIITLVPLPVRPSNLNPKVLSFLLCFQSTINARQAKTRTKRNIVYSPGQRTQVPNKTPCNWE